ncbi:unnamed protein product, partial [Durusdinium trenchii]
ARGGGGAADDGGGLAAASSGGGASFERVAFQDRDAWAETSRERFVDFLSTSGEAAADVWELHRFRAG